MLSGFCREDAGVSLVGVEEDVTPTSLIADEEDEDEPFEGFNEFLITKLPPAPPTAPTGPTTVEADDIDDGGGEDRD